MRVLRAVNKEVPAKSKQVQKYRDLSTQQQAVLVPPPSTPPLVRKITAADAAAHVFPRETGR